MNEKNSLPASNNDLDEVPPLTEEFFAHARHRVGLKPVGKKQKINLALDPDVVAWYKAQAGGRGYQTLMNAALREAMRARALVDVVRETIRQELKSA
ncbi:MAG: BrnA antitoxin family protein [Candidatus Accumulibacter sp.]|jgi:uncharacterized protein (DUF4415 family)|nr:BrnA antitoxin family protein [Accumulibacter sp.]